MKKFIYLTIVVIASAGLLVACEGGSSKSTSTENETTNETDNSNSNETTTNNNTNGNSNSTSNSASNSNSTSTQTSDSTSGDSSSTVNNTNVNQNVNIQIDQGQLPIYNPQTDDLNDVAVLNLHTVFDTGNNTPIESLRMCNDEKCWTLIDENNASQRSSRRPIAQRLTANKSTEDLGSFAVEEDNVSINSLKYKYNNIEGVLFLDNEVFFDKSPMRSIFLEAKETITQALDSISMPFGENILYLNDSLLEYKFDSGLILKIPSGTTKNNAIISVSSITDPQSKEPVKTHSIAFIDMSELDFDKNKIPTQLEKEIEVYMPILKSFDSTDYQLRLETENVEIIPYEIRKLNNISYVFFSTKKNMLNANFMKRISLLGE